MAAAELRSEPGVRFGKKNAASAPKLPAPAPVAAPRKAQPAQTIRGSAAAASAAIAPSAPVANEAHAAGRGDMIHGALWLVGGAAVTFATYQAAAGRGGTFMVAWGAMLAGCLRMLRGAWRAFIA